jgi:peptide/nickel transport system permease protein
MSAATSAGVGRRRLLPASGLVGSLALLAGLIIAVVVVPLLLPSPIQQDLNHILQPPSVTALLGTDQLGRDVLSRILAGIQIDLLIGVTALIVPVVLGSLLGALAAWRGGWADRIVGIFADVVQAFPYYLFILVLAFFLGAGIPSIYMAVAAVAWVSYARIVRAEVQSAMHRDYVIAAVGAGYREPRILLRHVLPNVIAQPLTYAVSDVVVVIVSTATLSYLGVGVTPPTPELGAMVAEGQQFGTTQPLLTLAPGLAIVLIGVILAMVGNALSRHWEDA